MQRINSRRELVELARELGVRPDWHEPDERELTAEVRGRSFDNAGFWGDERYGGQRHEELHVVLRRLEYDDNDERRMGEAIACVNLATLLAWATRLED